MKICDYLKKENILINIPISDKKAVLQVIADACVKTGVTKDGAAIYEGLQQREQMMSTGIGGGLAFPHTTSLDIQEAVVFLLRLGTPIDFEALDNRPVDTVLALLIPEDKKVLHLRLLARITRLCKNPKFIHSVRKAEDAAELEKEIRELEEKMSMF